MSLVRKGVTLSDALTAAAAVAPITRAMLFTFELRHPSLAEPFRFVDDKRIFVGTLEADAPDDAGAAVEFLPLPMSLQFAEESDQTGAPELRVALGHVSGVLGQALRAGRGSMVPWRIIERLYASDHPQAPARLPVVSYLLTSADIAALQALVTASYGDPANTAYPRLTFKREEYSGLA